MSFYLFLVGKDHFLLPSQKPLQLYNKPMQLLIPIIVFIGTLPINITLIPSNLIDLQTVSFKARHIDRINLLQNS